MRVNSQVLVFAGNLLENFGKLLETVGINRLRFQSERGYSNLLEGKATDFD